LLSFGDWMCLVIWKSLSLNGQDCRTDQSPLLLRKWSTSESCDLWYEIPKGQFDLNQ
jgi:hypothetical protein